MKGGRKIVPGSWIGHKKPHSPNLKGVAKKYPILQTVAIQQFLCTQNTHTLNTQPFYGSVEFVRENPGEPVPEEHSPTTLIAVINHPHQPSPSSTIHGIPPIQSTQNCTEIYLFQNWWVPAFSLPMSVNHIAKKDVHLTMFCHVSAQLINNVTKQKWLECTVTLLHRLKIHDTKHVFFTDEKNFYLNHPVTNQNSSLGNWQESQWQAKSCPGPEWKVCTACDGLSWGEFQWQALIAFCKWESKGRQWLLCWLSSSYSSRWVHTTHFKFLVPTKYRWNGLS